MRETCAFPCPLTLIPACMTCEFSWGVPSGFRPAGATVARMGETVWPPVPAKEAVR